jgi:integrase/recombinase XerC
MSRKKHSAASDIAAARLLLEKMGIDPADLLQEHAGPPEIPTFADYIPRVSQAVGDGTRRVYRTYWNRVVEAWGPRLITSVSPLEISQLAEDTKANVVHRRNARGGRGAAEHLISALRCMYNYAVADHFLSEDENPAARVPKPRRLRSTRMPLPDSRLSAIGAVAGSTGNDPALDSLIIRLHTETACRRGGALALTPEDLDPEQCLIRLHEKGGTDRWQPVSPTLMTHLLAHAESRGSLDSGERLLRYPDGTPITTRRYDHLWKRLGEHLPWVETQQVSTHWIRHTTLTWVERRFGFAVAQAYAGHEESNRGARGMGATGTYVRAGLPEVATALSALTGERHPLAPQGSGSELCPPALTAGQTVKHSGERHLPAGDGTGLVEHHRVHGTGGFHRLVALDEYAELRVRRPLPVRPGWPVLARTGRR